MNKIDTSTEAPVTLTYTNWKGETAQRQIIPRRIWWGSTEWHPEPQWLLTAFDVDKQADRDFALKDFGQPITVQDAARVEHVAFSLWKAEAERVAPNVARNRTPEMFSGELENTRAKWLSLADAALRAITEGRE